MMKQKEWVPKRRFKEFNNEWKKEKLGELYDVKSGYAFNRNEYVESGIPIINGESIHYGRINEKNLNYLPKEYIEKYSNFKVDPFDIVLGLNRPIINNNLKIAQVPKRMKNSLLYQRAGKVVNLKNIDIDFSYHLLGNEVFKFVLKEAVGSDQPFISTTKLKDWFLWTPKEEREQEKIGQFFKHLDEMITLEQRKIDKTKALKSACLAEMFPAEDERVPKRRFAGFTKSWRKYKLSDLTTIKRGLTYKPSSLSKTGVRVLRSSNINEDVFELRSDDVFVNNDAINIEEVKDNDILITSANGSTRLVGKHALVRDINTRTVHGGFMLLARSQQPFFINALMSAPWYKKFIEVFVSGGNGAIGNIGKGDLENQIVYVPCVKEQKKIGSFFKNLDDIITTHQQKLDKLKATKLAYLHELFV